MSNELIDRRAACWGEYRSLLADTADRDVSAEERQKFERMDAELERLQRALDTEERMRSNTSTTVDNAPVRILGSNSTTTIDEAEARYAQEFDTYIRRGTPPSEERAMSIGSDSSGGFVVPDSFRAKFVETLKVFGGVRNLAEVLTTSSGNPMLFPTSDQTSVKGEILSENTEAAEADASIGQKEVGAYTYSSKLVKVSRQLLQDAAVDIDAWLASKLGERIGRLQADHWAVGDDVGEPQGLTTGRDTGKDVDLATAGTITYGELVDLAHKPDPAYRGGAYWLMHDTVLAAVRKLVDGQSRPLWEPSLKEGVPSNLLGSPIQIDNSLPTKSSTTGQVQILYGSFRSAYLIREVQGVSVLRLSERFATANQVGVIAFARADGMVQDSAAYAALIN